MAHISAPAGAVVEYFEALQWLAKFPVNPRRAER